MQRGGVHLKGIPLMDNVMHHYNNYEKIRNSREGAGMVSIIGKACGGCYTQLPPQPIIEIKKSIDIITCPNCSIILFWDGVEE